MSYLHEVSCWTVVSPSPVSQSTASPFDVIEKAWLVVLSQVTAKVRPNLSQHFELWVLHGTPRFSVLTVVEVEPKFAEKFSQL